MRRRLRHPTGAPRPRTLLPARAGSPGVLGLFLLAGCLTPTQVTFDIRTDVPCEDVAFVGLGVGPAGSVEELPFEVVTKRCSALDDTANAIGSYAAVPQDGQVELDVRVAMAPRGGVMSDCTRRNGYRGCIVARRSISFLPRRSLVVPIDLYLVCRDIGCDAKSTCSRLGQCTSATVDLGQCANDICERTVGATVTEDMPPPPVAVRSTWAASPSILSADGVSASTLTLTLRDAFGKSVAGARPVLSISGSGNSWVVANDLTDDAGVFTAFVASTRAEEKTITVRVPGIELSTTVTFVGAATAQRVAAAGSHTCAIAGSGGLFCWGSNATGQLGDGTTEPRWTPSAVAGMSAGVASVASTGWHTCALTSVGGVKCWGTNFSGALGDGSATGRLMPTDVVGLSAGFTDIAAGHAHTCAVTSGVVSCWGSNSSGQLGDPTATANLTPTGVAGLLAVASIAAGGVATCAVTTSGKLTCWGRTTYPEDAGTPTSFRVPTDVPGLSSGVAGVAVGRSHICAVTTSGSLKCWGENREGQVGDGTTTNRPTPAQVSGLSSGVATVAAGFGHTCAVTTSGGLKCWGDNQSGQLGDGTTTDRHTPTDVVGLSSGVASVAAGSRHTCAVTVAGGLKCWGWNNDGQLGDGTNTDRLTPTDVAWP